MAKKQKINQSNSKLIRQRQVLFGGGLMLVALLLSIAFGSYLINWKSDSVQLVHLQTKQWLLKIF